MNEPIYDVVWPKSPRDVQSQRSAKRLDTLDGKRIAFVWDNLFRGDELFPILERELTTRFTGVEIVGYEAWGNSHGGDEADFTARLQEGLAARHIDAVISGMGC